LFELKPALHIYKLGASIKIGLFLRIIFCSSLWACGTNNDDRYIFFLHNRFLEKHELNELHPKFGRKEYNEIIAKFKKNGFKVFSQKGTEM
jgi:hypothetical protein